MKQNAVQRLIKQVGNEDACLLLGVHHHTLYKWTITDDKNASKREPGAATIRLAEVFLFLMNDWNWKLDELRDLVNSLK